MRIGDRVEGRYGEKDRWHFGKIASINPDGTIDLTYDSDMWNGWSALTEYGVKAGFFKVHKSGGNDQSLPPPSVAPPAPPSTDSMVSESPKFHIGQRVEAKPVGRSKWYGGTVMHVNNGGDTFKIKYDSGMWNAYISTNEPKVEAQNIRCYADDRDAAGFDHSPIRKASDEPTAPTPAQTRNNGRGRKSVTETQPERMTRAQAAKAEKEASAAAAEAAPTAPPPSTTKKQYVMRETNAMRAQKEAALKRRQTLESNELKKYGETFESKKEQKAAKEEAEAKKHTFLKRGDSKTIPTPTTTTTSYTSRVGASAQKSLTSDDVLAPSHISNTPGDKGNKRQSASNQYRAQHEQEMQQQQQQKQLKQQKQKDQMKKQQQQLQKQNSLQEKIAERSRGLSPTNSQTGSSNLPNKRSQTADDVSSVSSSSSQSQSMVKKNNNQANAPVVVIVRKRPAKEGETDVIKCFPPIVICNENKVKVDLTKYVHTHKFCYDRSFGENHTTLDLYDQSISSLIDNFMGGGSSTCFCFGQTASGKTFTLFGAGGGQVMEDGEDMEPEAGGVYMLAAQDVFAKLETAPELTLSVSMFEIYGQKVRDLLDNGKELAALEDGKGVLQLVGLTGEECDNMSDFIHVSNVGRLARSTTATGANATSSRSHAAMLLRLVRKGPIKDGKPKASLGKFSLIDLAGSERGADNENTDKTTQMEGRQINQSLLALKEVIRAKELGRAHAPFRQSRLTQVLEESLTGRHCLTVVIGCISPNEKDIQQTVNTLRYAEGLRPGLKKDLAKKEKEAYAREEARLLSIEESDEDDEAFLRQQFGRQPPPPPQESQQQLVSKQMITQKERELLRIRQEEENKCMMEQNEDFEFLNEESDFQDNLDDGDYCESISPVALTMDDGEDEEEDDLRAAPSIDLDDEGSYRRASEQYQDEEDEEYEECQEDNEESSGENSEEDEEGAGYRAYNGAGEVTDMLRESDKAEVEALLAKQDRTLSQAVGGKYQSSSVRRHSSSKKINNTNKASKTNNPPQKYSAKFQADTIAQYEAENLDNNNNINEQNKESNKKGTPSKTPSNRSNKTNHTQKNNVVVSTSALTASSTQSMRKGSLKSFDEMGNEISTSITTTSSDSEIVAALQWRLKERDAELAEKDKLIESLTNRVSDLNRAVVESDTIRAQQASALKRERDRIEAVERTYHEAMMKLEADIEESLEEKEGLLAELDDKDQEVNQLVAEVEDREGRNNELKLMLKKLLETQAPPAPPSSASKSSRNSTGGGPGTQQQRTTRSATKNKSGK